MINTENNESVLDVVQKKKFIKNIYSKIVNLENEVELKNLLSFAISEKMKERYDYRDIVRLSSDEMNLNNHLNKDVDENLDPESKLPFFKNISSKAANMDNNSRDIFWSMMYTIIKLSDNMVNYENSRAEMLYKRSEDFSGDTYGFYRFSLKWITNQITLLYPVTELVDILSVFDLSYSDTIEYLVENVVKQTETELPFQDPCLVNILSDLLDCICISVDFSSLKSSNFDSDSVTSVKFDFREVVAPSFCDIQNNGCEPYKDINRKIFIGKFFQFVIQDSCLDGCEVGSENWKILNKYKERFFSDEYLIEFLKSEVEKYSKEYLLEKV